MLLSKLIPPPLQSSSSEAGFTLIEKMVIVAILGIFASFSVPSVMGTLNRAKLKQTVAEVRTALNETQREAIRGNKICTVTLNFVDGKVTGNCLKTGDRNLASEVEIATNLMGNSPVTSDPLEPLIQSDMKPSIGLNNGLQPSLIALSNLPDKGPTLNTGMVVQVITQCKSYSSSDVRSGDCKMHLAQQFDDSDNVSPSPSATPSDTPSPSPTPQASYTIPIRYGVLGNPEFSVVSEDATPSDPTGKIVFFFPDDAQAKKHCIAISNTLGLTRIGTYTGDITPLAITNSGRCTAENWKTQ